MDYDSSYILNDSGMHLLNLCRLVGRCESGRLQRGTKHHCSVVCVPVEKKLQKKCYFSPEKWISLRSANNTNLSCLTCGSSTFLTNLFSISNQPHEPRVVNRIGGGSLF